MHVCTCQDEYRPIKELECSLCTHTPQTHALAWSGPAGSGGHTQARSGPSDLGEGRPREPEVHNEAWGGGREGGGVMGVVASSGSGQPLHTMTRRLTNTILRVSLEKY